MDSGPREWYCYREIRQGYSHRRTEFAASSPIRLEEAMCAMCKLNKNFFNHRRFDIPESELKGVLQVFDLLALEITVVP